MLLEEPSQKGFVRPTIDPDSRPWWSELAKGRFTLPLCGNCHRRSFPPLPLCPHCGSDDVELTAAETGGAVYSWVVINRALNPNFSHDVPYTIAAVDLDAGTRLVGRLFESADALVAGLRVTAEIYEADGHCLVGFRPSQGGGHE